MTTTADLYAELNDHARTTAVLASCASVLGWDQQTHLPPRGTPHRAEQLSLLAGLVNERQTAPRLGALLDELEACDDLDELDSDSRANVREARKDYDRATKVPRSLVEEMTRVRAQSQQAWVQARKDGDYGSFEPWLSRVLDLKRQEAEAIGYGDGEPYDALLQDYEPGATAAQIESIFTPLRAELVSLLQDIAGSGRVPDRSILTRHYPTDAQEAFGRAGSAAIGFSYDAGRIDVAPHPFCSGFGPGDTRLTTRFDESFFASAFFGTLHESGHGIYEQGLDPEAFGMAKGRAVSLGIHESQSRLWENLVGRSRAFWEYFWPQAVQAFPEALGDVDFDSFHWALNDVRPSLIRVEADEVTYNLHVMLRTELEQALLRGDLLPADLPGAWNDAMADYIGVRPDGDANGCMQDMHWSAGLFGYFPTYTLGNLNAAQLFVTASEELGDLQSQFARGEFDALKAWLNTKVHARGACQPAGELIEDVTGQPLSSDALLAHLNARFRPLYGLS